MSDVPTFDQVHDGKVADYTGSVIVPGCCVKVTLDLVRQVRRANTHTHTHW